MYLYHYYDNKFGPFRNLSDVSTEAANSILEDIRKTNPQSYCAQRQPEYMNTRHHYEEMARRLFIEKGGKPVRLAPHYMVVEHSQWLSSWYENCSNIKIPVEEFDYNTISFTYGDMFPTFSPRVKDGKEYRKKLYLYPEILQIIEKYGLPQDWNDDGKYGPERYIEVQIWSDEVIRGFITPKMEETSKT